VWEKNSYVAFSVYVRVCHNGRSCSLWLCQCMVWAQWHTESGTYEKPKAFVTGNYFAPLKLYEYWITIKVIWIWIWMFRHWHTNDVQINHISYLVIILCRLTMTTLWGLIMVDEIDFINTHLSCFSRKEEWSNRVLVWFEYAIQLTSIHYDVITNVTGSLTFIRSIRLIRWTKLGYYCTYYKDQHYVFCSGMDKDYKITGYTLHNFLPRKSIILVPLTDPMHSYYENSCFSATWN
jgi:hypothetical protein